MFYVLLASLEKKKTVVTVAAKKRGLERKKVKNERYYHRTDEQLVQFANWKPEFEK